MEKFKNKKLLTGLLLASLVLIMVGGTFAALDFTRTSDQNLIKSGKVSMSYTESTNVINITDALPISDEIGKNSTEFFDFTIMSNADTNAGDNEGIKIPYNLIVEPKVVDSDKDALTSEQIKVYLTKVEGATETEVIAPTKISELTPVNSNFNLYSTQNIHKNNNGTITTDYRLRAWIDYDVESKDWNQASKQKQYKFGVNVNATAKENSSKMTVEEFVTAKLGTDGLVAESHPATEQLQATTDYRYIGKDPNNYIKFNNERWRIIGVFEVDNGKGNLEKRIKIIRNSIGNMPWDSSGFNDWTTASGMKLLNSGDYWNKTGAHSLNGLSEEAKSQIANAKWYLGGHNSYFNQDSGGLVCHWYEQERGTEVYNSRKDKTNWVGKVGLMYPSDYGYATSGGATTNRDACLAKKMSDWYDTSVSDCKDNDWLIMSYSEWTLTRYIAGQYYVFSVGAKGSISWGSRYANDPRAIRPTVYLKSDIKITGGDGTFEKPYELPKNSSTDEDEANNGAKTIIAKLGRDGLTENLQPATAQTLATTDYRYTGANPNNYIKFNNETWRIIGVFDTDDGTGKLEKRIKIIRKENLDTIAWDKKSDGSYANDWPKATLMTLLNSGDYWNRTGSYLSTGLTDEAKSLIADTKWYLGGTANYTSTSNGLASHFYGYERGTTVYDSTRPTSWVGKVGLMYPSDYGYATSGGTDHTRYECLEYIMYDWDSQDLTDCPNSDWLYDSSNTQWTLTPNSEYSGRAFVSSNDGAVFISYVSGTKKFRPTVYLSSDVQITGGDGSSATPYEISK